MSSGKGTIRIETTSGFLMHKIRIRENCDGGGEK